MFNPIDFTKISHIVYLFQSIIQYLMCFIEIDVNYQTAEFIVNGKKYLSHYDINWLDLNIHKKKRVIIEYLPLNPKINRFREDYTDKSYNLISILIRLLLSTIFPLSILVNYRKN